MKKSKLLLAALVSLFFAACGGGASSPEEVAEKYAKASLKSDFSTCKSLATEKMKAELEKQEKDQSEVKSKDIPPEKKEMMEKMKALNPKAEEAKISEDGNSATVSVNLLKKDGEREMTFKYKMLKENGKWKVDAQSK